MANPIEKSIPFAVKLEKNERYRLKDDQLIVEDVSIRSTASAWTGSVQRVVSILDQNSADMSAIFDVEISRLSKEIEQLEPELKQLKDASGPTESDIKALMDKYKYGLEDATELAKVEYGSTIRKKECELARLKTRLEEETTRKADNERFMINLKKPHQSYLNKKDSTDVSRI